MTLKWSGDFTLPRLRAKLASKYLLHPAVEPEYDEIYKPELSRTSIMRRDGSFTSLRDQVDALEAQPPANRTQSYQTSLQATLGRNATANLSGTLGGNLTNFSGLDATMPRNGSSASLKELPQSMRMRKVASVPTLGIKRNDRAPASLQPLPPDLKPPGATQSQKSLKLATTQRPPTPTSPSGQPVEVDQRALDREKQIETASRRFWNAAHGNMHFLQEELVQLKRDDPSMGHQQIINKMKGTGACKQMNDLRRKPPGIKLNWQHEDWDGATLLLRAVRTDQQALVYHLLGLGLSCNEPTPVHQFRDNSGRGVVHWCAIEGNAELTDLFLEVYPDLQDQVTGEKAADSGGDTPLHLAAYHGHLPVVRMLIRSGADPNIANEQTGFTPYQLAESHRMWHITRYLADFRQQEEDKANKDLLMNLLRPCNMARAHEVRLELSELPKPKK